MTIERDLIERLARGDNAAYPALVRARAARLLGVGYQASTAAPRQALSEPLAQRAAPWIARLLAGTQDAP